MDITTSFTPVESFSPEQAKKWMNERKAGEFTLLDVRQPAEYQGGHIPGAVLIPLPELAGRMGEVLPVLPVIAYCRSGNRSRSAAALLAEAGRTVFNLEGGMLAWKGLVAAGAADRGMQLVKGRVTTAQMASLAWALEEGAASFYRTIQNSVDNEEVRRIFQTLAAAEDVHKRKVLDAFRSVDRRQETDQVIGETLQDLMEGGFTVEGTIGHLRSQGFPLAETLETAMQIEANSLDLYMKVIRWSGMPDVKVIFSALVEEEKLHLARLGALLDDAVG